MSKSILGIGLTIVGAALLFTGIGAPLGLGAIAFGATTYGAIVGLGLEIAGSLLLGPSVPKSSLTNTATQRLYATMVTTEPRKICFGEGAGTKCVRIKVA